MGDAYEFICRFAVFAACHSFLATVTVRSRIKKLLGNGWRFYRLGYNLLSIAMFGWVMAAYRNAPVIYLIPGGWGLLCYLAQAMLLLIILRCAAQTGIGEFLGIDQVRGRTATATLITTGCYGKVRHPQYSLAVIFLLLNPVMTLKWLALTVLSTSYFVLGALLEEKRMAAEFGEEFLHYRRETPMFLPGIWGRRNAD